MTDIKTQVVKSASATMEECLYCSFIFRQRNFLVRLNCIDEIITAALKVGPHTGTGAKPSAPSVSGNVGLWGLLPPLFMLQPEAQ